MRVTTFLIMGCLLAALPGAAQYGGRPGDTVLYVLTSKGSGAIQTLPLATSNTASGLQIIDPTTVTPQPFPSNFPQEYRLLLHAEAGDVFEFLVEAPLIQTQRSSFPLRSWSAKACFGSRLPERATSMPPRRFTRIFRSTAMLLPTTHWMRPISSCSGLPAKYFPLALRRRQPS
jgi:hypothetical protein